MQNTYTFDFKELRCPDCGTFWAIENGRSWNVTNCPKCASKRIEQMQQRVETYQRKLRGLRGAFVRLKSAHS